MSEDWSKCDRNALGETIRVLQADRDALAAENAKLRDALRGKVIKHISRMEPTIPHGDDGIAARDLCQLCGEFWIVSMGESHAPGCIAAQEEPRT